MGMGMSMSPQIWQKFVDLIFQDDLIKCKQNFDGIMDDTFIHSTEESTWMILCIFQGTMEIWFKNITTQMSIFSRNR